MTLTTHRPVTYPPLLCLRIQAFNRVAVAIRMAVFRRGNVDRLLSRMTAPCLKTISEPTADSSASAFHWHGTR
jgi:hypothetical protein